MEQLPKRPSKNVTPDFFQKYYSKKELESMYTWDLALLSVKHNLVSQESIFEPPTKIDRSFYIQLLSDNLSKPKKKVVIRKGTPIKKMPKFDRDYFLSKDFSYKKMLKDLNMSSSDGDSTSSSSEESFM